MPGLKVLQTRWKGLDRGR